MSRQKHSVGSRWQGKSLLRNQLLSGWMSAAIYGTLLAILAIHSAKGGEDWRAALRADARAEFYRRNHGEAWPWESIGENHRDPNWEFFTYRVPAKIAKTLESHPCEEVLSVLRDLKRSTDSYNKQMIKDWIEVARAGVRGHPEVDAVIIIKKPPNNHVISLERHFHKYSFRKRITRT